MPSPSLINLLRAVIDGEQLTSSQIDQIPVGFASQCGLAPLLYFSHGHSVKAHPSAALQELYGTSLAARMMAANQLETLTALLTKDRELATTCILLKGVATALAYYPEFHLRPMGDIDLLIPNSAAQKQLEQTCFEMGFEQDSPYEASFYENFHHSMPLHHRQKNVWLEIHTEIIPTARASREHQIFRAKNLYENHSEVFRFGQVECRTLKPEMNLVFTSLHWAMEANWQKSAARILDIALLLKHEQEQNEAGRFDWNILHLILEQSPEAARATYVMLSFVHENFYPIGETELRAVAKHATPINPTNLKILHRLILRHSLEGKPFGAFLSQSNASILWSALIFRGDHPLLNLLWHAPRSIVFPPNAANPFSLSFQLSRLKNLFSAGSNQ